MSIVSFALVASIVLSLSLALPTPEQWDSQSNFEIDSEYEDQSLPQTNQHFFQDDIPLIRNIYDKEPQHPLLNRNKRQAVDQAVGLALNHNGKVGEPHGKVDLNINGNNARNYHAQMGAGVGSVLYRSNDARHSVGAGAYVGQGAGRYEGHRYSSKPDVGVGVGYRFRF